MSSAFTEFYDPNRYSREPKELKAETTLHRITLTTNTANPGETLYITIPKLARNIVIVPKSVSILFDLEIAGHANRRLNNVARCLVQKFKVSFGGECLQDTQ